MELFVIIKQWSWFEGILYSLSQCRFEVSLRPEARQIIEAYGVFFFLGMTFYILFLRLMLWARRQSYEPGGKSVNAMSSKPHSLLVTDLVIKWKSIKTLANYLLLFNIKSILTFVWIICMWLDVQNLNLISLSFLDLIWLKFLKNAHIILHAWIIFNRIQTIEKWVMCHVINWNNKLRVCIYGIRWSIWFKRWWWIETVKNVWFCKRIKWISDNVILFNHC